jgi:hypothetical protein
MNVRIRDVAMQMRVVDGESILTPELMQRIVSAVVQELRVQQDHQRSRMLDVQVDADCGCKGGGEHA